MEALVVGAQAILRQIEGTKLDTPKTVQLAQAAKVLSGKYGKVGRDVSAAILDMYKKWERRSRTATRT